MSETPQATQERQQPEHWWVTMHIRVTYRPTEAERQGAANKAERALRGQVWHVELWNEEDSK